MFAWATGFGIHFTWPGGAFDVGIIALVIWPMLALVSGMARRYTRQRDEAADLRAEVIRLRAAVTPLHDALTDCVGWYDEHFAGDEGTIWHVYGYYQFEKARKLLVPAKTE